MIVLMTALLWLLQKREIGDPCIFGQMYTEPIHSSLILYFHFVPQ